MKNYQEIRQESEVKLNSLLKKCGVFFAFSNEQFQENKTPLQEGDKYVGIGHGGYIPKGKVKEYIEGMDEIETWEKREIKKVKDAKREHIAYELSSHECYYTGDISDALAVLPYPKKDVLKVYLDTKEEVLARN